MRRLFNKKAQTTLEYAILIAVVVGVLIAMQTYVKRGMQGRLKDATDFLATTSEQGTGQWEPTTTQIDQDMSHNAYSSTYDVAGDIAEDRSGRGTTWDTDVTTTPWGGP